MEDFLANQQDVLELQLKNVQLEETNKSLEARLRELQESYDKTQKDLSRLKAHLIEIEENHSIEIVSKDEQIETLANQIEDLKLKSTDDKKKDGELGNLKLQLNNKELECERLTEALSKLQGVLEQLQSEQDSKINSEIVLLKSNMSSLENQVTLYKSELDKLQDINKKYHEAEASIRDLQQELSNKTKLCIKLQEEVEPLKKVLEQTLHRLSSLSKNEQENMVDKRLVSKLILTYFEGKTNKTEILELMAKLLNFSDQEKAKIGLGPKSSWSFLPFFGDPSSPVTIEKDSLTDLWINFLLKEAQAESEK